MSRCPNHEHNDETQLKAHIVRAEHADAQYGQGIFENGNYPKIELPLVWFLKIAFFSDANFGREVVTVPFEKPQAGMNVNEYIYKFMCNK